MNWQREIALLNVPRGDFTVNNLALIYIPHSSHKKGLLLYINIFPHTFKKNLQELKIVPLVYVYRSLGDFSSRTQGKNTPRLCCFMLTLKLDFFYAQMWIRPALA